MFLGRRGCRGVGIGRMRRFIFSYLLSVAGRGGTSLWLMPLQFPV